MKKFYLLLTLITVTALNQFAFSQTDIAIGTGTTGNGATTYPCPIQDRYEASRAQYLYKASELTTAGMSPGFISGIRFNVTSAAGIGVTDQYAIRIGGTTVNTLSASSWETGTVTKFGPVDYQVVNGINTFNFTSNFFWNGTDNIIIEPCNGPLVDLGTMWTNNPVIPWTTGLSFNGSHTYIADVLDLCGTTNTANTGTQTSRPNIIFRWTPALACSGTPSAGTATGSPANVCLNNTFTLNATGVTVASGLTYQWQSSTDNFAGVAPIIDVPFATAISYTGTQTATNYYRLKVTCTAGGAFSYSNTILITSPVLAGGTYTIDNLSPASATNFISFNSAVDYLRCGIIAPVIFNVVNNPANPYNEQVINIPLVPGSSTTNTITFNGNGATIGTATTTTAERAILKLKGAKHFRFNNLNINAGLGAFGYGVQLFNNADSNVVNNCNITSNLTATTTNYAGIVVSGIENNPIGEGITVCDGNSFTNNTITGGYAGITIAATFAGGGCTGNLIRGNDIKDFYTYGVYLSGTGSTTVEKNLVHRPLRTIVTDFYGIYLTSQKNTSALISKNKVVNGFGGVPASTSAFYGINFNNSDASVGAESTVQNNLVYDSTSGNGIVYGIVNTGSDYVYYFHNTVALENATATTASATRGFYQTTTAAGLFFYNNIISIKRGGTGVKHAIYLGSGVLPGQDNNLYYINAPGTNYIGFLTSNRASLNDWKTATAQEAASLNLEPAFNDAVNLNFAPNNAGIDNKGLDLGVVDDINNTPRSTTPDIGAWEFIPPPCTVPPVTGVTVVSPLVTCQNTPVLLNLNIGGYGSAQTFQWQYSENATGPWINMGAPKLTPDTTINADTTRYYRVEIKCTSSILYTNEVLLTVNPALKSAVYTINKGGTSTFVPGLPGGNFLSFADAKAAMNCGITGGPVVFNVVSGSGPYAEQFKLDYIKGTSATSTITFNGNGNTITSTATTSNERAIIKLNGAKYIIFDSLTIDASAAASYGHGVQLINNADSNIVRKCNIISSTTSTTTNYAGIVVNFSDAGATTIGNTLCDYNIFDGNTITGGYYGITLMGSNTAAALINDNKITNNIIKDFYSYGIYAGGTYNTLIEGNIISRPTRSVVAAAYGIYLTTAVNNLLKISKNRITNLFGGALASTLPQYGVYHNSIDATSGNQNVVSNNLIYGLNGAGPMYGMYNTSSDNVYYYHNTISIDDISLTSSAVAEGLYQTGAAIAIEYKNNIVTINRGGNGIKHAISLLTSTSEVASDYNDFYVSGTNAFVGTNGTNRLTLANWQTATGKDANSLSLDPVYINPAGGNYMPGIISVDNKGTNVGITTDILNVTRNSPPDIGAYEFAPPACVSTPVAGTASVTPNSGICLETAITLTLTGNSPIGTLTFQWQVAPSATGPWTNIGPVLFTPTFNTTTTVSNFYRAVVTCGTTSTISTVTSVTLNAILPAGTYTINSANPTNWPSVPGGINFNSFQDAVTALQCGIGGAVVFDVAAGTYNERIDIGYIPGVSATSTVTFKSATGNAADANLSFNATAAPNYTLRLNNTKYFIFKNMSITALSTTNGRVVEFAGNASNDSLVNCIITAPTIANTANTFAAVYGVNTATTSINNIVVQGNTVNKGSNGIYFAGVSTTVLAPSSTVIIDNNTVNGSYFHGIYTQFTDRIKIINNTVNLNATTAANTAGIHVNYSDSAFTLKGNKVNISNNASSLTYGVYVFNTRASDVARGLVASNTINAVSGNTGTIYGLAISTSKGLDVINNVIGINSAGATAYGIYNFNNALTAGDSVNFYNNTSNITSTSANGYSGYFQNSAAAKIQVINNVFSNKGGGRALYVNTPNFFTGDYNLLYTTGPNLVQVQTPAANFTTLRAWKTTWNWDQSAISIEPAFVSNTDLRPDVTNANSWAMNGRGLQIKKYTKDFNDNYRPDSLTAGVPDLGAYEFYPTVIPPVLQSIPATPAPNTEQTFYFGTDTVQRIKWGASAPPTINLRRYSGDVGPGLNNPVRPDSMFFYTKVDALTPNNYPFATKLYYYDSWMGSIKPEAKLGLGRTAAPGGSWTVSFTSKVNTIDNEISQESMVGLDKFTGLFNPFAVLENEDSSSNRGKDFWVGYQRSYDFAATGGAQQMVLYFGAGEVPADVTVTIEGTSGTPWVRNYTIPANTAIQSDFIPKTGTDDARLTGEGLFAKKGIHIESTAPIAAYAHIYSGANSGATMLLPTSVWGYEFYTLNSEQFYTTTNSHSVFHIVAQHDSTWVEINPSKPTTGGWTLNGGTRPNGSYLVKLNKGDAYQVQGAYQSGSIGHDLTGSYVKSIANGQDSCFPIGVFAGSSRTYITCTNATTASGGDLIIQQIFPYQAWGTKYITAPTSNSEGPSAATIKQDVFRVMVKDPATVVKRNGLTTTLGPLISGRYYEYNSQTPDIIESNKPILVAQYIGSNGGGCGNDGTDGDPEMFYLSPVEQAIKKTQFYRNNLSAIDENFVTLVIKTEGVASLKVDGLSYAAQPATPITAKYTYTHPNIPGYSVVTLKWQSGVGFSKVESEFPFTGIVYGLGSVESYGYNMGTLVKNLNNASSVNPDSNQNVTPTNYSCKGAPFSVQALLPVQADSIKWLFSQVPHLQPNTDSIQHNPVSVGTTEVGGVTYYIYNINQSFVMDTAGLFSIPIEFWSSEIESCDKKKRGAIFLQILPAPENGFEVTFPGGATLTSGAKGCEGDALSFTGNANTQTGIGVYQWDWEFGSGVTANGQNQTQTYSSPGIYTAKLKSVTIDGCLSDSVRTFEILAKPVVTVVTDNISACAGSSVTFTISNPVAGVVYNWYDAATGGNLVGTGISFTATNVAPPQSFWAEGTNGNCVSLVRKQVTVSTLAPLAQAVTTVASSTANTVTFNWTAVAGAVSYEVSIDGGTTWITPSSGTLGTSHTVTGVGTLQSVSLLVRTNGTLSCQSSISAATAACTNSSAAVTAVNVQICTNTTATFSVQNPEAGITYTWYTAAVGGTVAGTGTTFTTGSLATNTSYYVEQSNTLSGCTGSPRTQINAIVNAILPQAVATVSSANATSVTFTWAAVTGATSYEVSINGGTTWITPSSGSTGLTHTVTGLGTLQSVNLLVRANGVLACQSSVSSAASGCSNSAPAVVASNVQVCTGTPATFTVQSPVAGLTYSWYNVATGGTPLATGTSYSPTVSGTATFYVEQSNTTSGCVGTPRTIVTATILGPLANPLASLDSAGVNFIRFKWNAVAGAATYQVSIDNGATWITPSSGATGLTHTVVGLLPLQEVTIIVRATGVISCQTSTSAPFTARTLVDGIYIPNTFTPNGDGKNDVLLAYGYVIESMVFTVYNQWGEKIFESRSQQNGWNGTYKGKQQAVGVYIYVAKFILKDGSVIDRKGSINLVR